ncbi:MAG: DEAD/DEAH box helicase [Synechococcales cyanobacterium RM1_1_8]|nr:DEAD/DEAH box helicase [Synechococcales cyanobacterium RM1_1_8]
MTVSFASLGLSDNRIAKLTELGFEEPTQIQAEAIPHLLAGREVLGQAQTGTGKTAAFALPILERVDPSLRTVQALVLTPTRELAQQVAQAMREFNIAMAGTEGERSLRPQILTVYGGQPIERQIQRLERGVQIVVGTPGRILDLLRRRCLDLSRVEYLVLDEADEMLSMGFLPDVETILSEAPEKRQMAFFSATMPSSIRRLANDFLTDPVIIKVKAKDSISRINQVVYNVPRGWSKAKALLPVMAYEEPESAIIFVRTRRTAAELTSYLQSSGYSVDEYHGDLSQSQRERMLERFKQKQVRWIVATDIAARGIHVDDLTHVVNFDLPDSVENYVHRIGRTGRAGKEGIAIVLAQGYDRRKLRDIEFHTKQTLEPRNVPTRAQIESRHLERFKEQVAEVLGGERVASFLSIVSELAEDYDPHTVAAAALQMAYDKTRPEWLSPEWGEDAPDDYRAARRGGSGGGGGGASRGRSNYRGAGGAAVAGQRRRPAGSKVAAPVKRNQ